jgi:predicted regulator of Ras-like GTPase activity (Roadblock/LC7/MglB family)
MTSDNGIHITGDAGAIVGMEISAEAGGILRAAVDEYRAESMVRFAALLSEGGVVLASSGTAAERDIEAAGALAAGVFASLRALSERIGERNFEGCFQHGRTRHFHLCEVSPGLLLFSVFGNDVTPGLIRLYSEKATRRIVRAFANVRSGPSPAASARRVRQFA